MPVSKCIENKTLVRICLFELKKPAEEVSEDEWNQRDSRIWSTTLGEKCTEDAALGCVDQGCPVSGDEISEFVARAAIGSRHGEFPAR